MTATINKPLQVYFSNRVEQLYQALKQTLFTETAPFMRRMIVVPSPAMKSWLMLQMANDPDLGIAAGIEISYLDHTIDQLNTLLEFSRQPNESQSPPTSPTHLTLALALEGEIRLLIKRTSNLTSSEAAIWKPLLEYLKLSNTHQSHQPLSRQTDRRLTSLCDKLAKLFTQYGKHAGLMAEEWERTLISVPASSWQQQLWRLLFHSTRPYNWTYLYRALTSYIEDPTAKPSRSDIQIHLFAMSYVAPLQHRFLTKIAQDLPVFTYMLSPCQAFWSDILSDRESQSIKKYWKSRNISQGQEMALEEFLRDRNPLLANFGRLGREMAQQLEESQAITSEEYVLSSDTAVQPSYQESFTEDVLWCESDRPLTMLEAIQADMALLRNPERTSKIKFSADDQSIQVHVAITRMREVQVLYDRLLGIIHRHARDETAICPGDILVMAPDISAYTPYIRAVFGAPDSQLEAQIMDLGMHAQSTFIQAFMHLLSLPLSRWDAAAILQLFDYSAFQRRQGLTRDDVRNIREWTMDSGVRWGEDAAHRNELLQRDHCRYGMVDNTEFGTWDFAAGKLLSGIVFSAKTQVDIEANDGPLLGKWLNIMRSLRADLKLLNDGTCLTLNEWSSYLHCICEAYFSPTDKEDNAEEMFKALSIYFDAFQQAGKSLQEVTYPFSTIRYHLLTELKKPQTSYREGALQAVRFCSLLPMRAIPAQVIAIMGMEEGAYPRQEVGGSLNLMTARNDVDYSPSQIDYDRFLFLETLLSARRYFVISYQGYAEADGKEQPPSLLVTEVLTYLDKAYCIQDSDALPSVKCVYNHPYHSFDKSCFSSNTLTPSFSQKHYQAAKAYYHQDKITLSSFVSAFEIKPNMPSHTTSEVIRVNLKDLVAFARNPVKVYFNKTLGIYLDKAEERILKNEEEFHLTSLQRFILKKDAFKLSVKQILQWAEHSGHLPVGAFKGVAVERIQREIESLRSNLNDLGVLPHEIFEISFSEQHEVPQQSEHGHWQLPHLQIQLGSRQVHISGNMSEVTTRGLITQLKDDKTDIVKAWPEFLVLSCLKQKYQLPIASQLLITKGVKGKVKEAFCEDPEVLLMNYLDYYFTGLEHVSPLIPEWVPHLMAPEDEFDEKMRSSLENTLHPLRNEYLRWAVQGVMLPDAEVLVKTWKPRAQQLFAEMYRHWYPSKTGSA